MLCSWSLSFEKVFVAKTGRKTWKHNFSTFSLYLPRFFSIEKGKGEKINMRGSWRSAATLGLQQNFTHRQTHFYNVLVMHNIIIIINPLLLFTLLCDTTHEEGKKGLHFVSEEDKAIFLATCYTLFKEKDELAPLHTTTNTPENAHTHAPS